MAKVGIGSLILAGLMKLAGIFLFGVFVCVGFWVGGKITSRIDRRFANKLADKLLEEEVR